jgi:hypothetical protein
MNDTKGILEQEEEKQLSDREQEEVSGGLNPQPLPPLEHEIA